MTITSLTLLRITLRRFLRTRRWRERRRARTRYWYTVLARGGVWRVA